MLTIKTLNSYKNTTTSQSQLNTVGLCDLKRHEPGFGEEYLQLLFKGSWLKYSWLWDPKII
jgi:hypothetical protein